MLKTSNNRQSTRHAVQIVRTVIAGAGQRRHARGRTCLTMYHSRESESNTRGPHHAVELIRVVDADPEGGAAQPLRRRPGALLRHLRRGFGPSELLRTLSK